MPSDGSPPVHLGRPVTGFQLRSPSAVASHRHSCSGQAFPSSPSSRCPTALIQCRFASSGWSARPRSLQSIAARQSPSSSRQTPRLYDARAYPGRSDKALSSSTRAFSRSPIFWQAAPQLDRTSTTSGWCDSSRSQSSTVSRYRRSPNSTLPLTCSACKSSGCSRSASFNRPSAFSLSPRPFSAAPRRAFQRAPSAAIPSSRDRAASHCSESTRSRAISMPRGAPSSGSQAITRS